jgi:hypothetical protein
VCPDVTALNPPSRYTDSIVGHKARHRTDKFVWRRHADQIKSYQAFPQVRGSRDLDRHMNDINEIKSVALTVHGSRPTLHLKNGVPKAFVRVRSGIAREGPVVRVFPRKDLDHPKSAAFVSADATSRPASWS